MTDFNCEGRTFAAECADRIAAIERGGGPITDRHRNEATALLIYLLDAADRCEFTLDDFDWVTDLPGACVDVVLAKASKEGWR